MHPGPNNGVKYSKLERLLAQPDIFHTLLKISNGTIKSFDDLPINQNTLQAENNASAMKRGGQEQNNDDEEEYEILKIEK